MKNFAKSILNYFAAFNETRFRFSSKLPYEWSNNSFTLDFSVFPAFEKQLLDAIGQGTSFGFEVRKGEYTVTLTSDDFKKALLSQISDLCLDRARGHHGEGKTGMAGLRCGSGLFWEETGRSTEEVRELCGRWHKDGKAAGIGGRRVDAEPGRVVGGCILEEERGG